MRLRFPTTGTKVVAKIVRMYNDEPFRYGGGV
jgi:hypothetical protein